MPADQAWESGFTLWKLVATFVFLFLNGFFVAAEFALVKVRPSRMQEVMAEKQIGLAVVGARGRTAGAAVLLGSVTEDLIRVGDFPVLAVKQKGEGMDLLEALFSS